MGLNRQGAVQVSKFVYLGEFIKENDKFVEKLKIARFPS